MFATATRKLRYDHLVATDARGDTLAARLELAGGDRFRIVVDDAAAAYPLAIDPLISGTADTQLESDVPAAQFGISIASAGDVNGDGYGDVLVGARRYRAGQIAEGAAWVWPGSASGIADGDPATAAVQFDANQVNASFGESVAGAGDLNGDGYADLVVGATEYDAGQTDEGAAFVSLGNPDIHLVPEPGVGLALTSGITLLAALARRRARVTSARA